MSVDVEQAMEKEPDFSMLGHMSAVFALSGVAFVLIVFMYFLGFPLGVLLGAIGLVTVGSIVVGSLVFLSFQEEDDH